MRQVRREECSSSLWTQPDEAKPGCDCGLMSPQRSSSSKRVAVLGPMALDGPCSVHAVFMSEGRGQVLEELRTPESI